ncbi:DUF1853 family protein [Pseudomonas sp. gcc21]|uniref:DUF1853 family protein n=1 Tax=Pseudomonas sp. gcc21 TaxID=2726989 RepID=UPI0014514336|nr:DUF1853 family protein [Pseudomonas sp. gcc21]QJD58611.1 DUF1853 family protein [Pseudomonas sp. gcc21]
MLDLFSHPQVRDLAWIACSESLLKPGILAVRDPLTGSVWRQDPESLLYRLKQLDADPVPLQQLIPVSRDLRLGNYYERLWHALLHLAPDVRLLAHNVALRGNGRTLGELDLLMEDPAGAVIHLELAVKFYLGVPEQLAQPQSAGTIDQSVVASSSPHSAWLGPDPRDTLDDKVKRLRDHQLKLVDHLHLAATPLPRPDLSAAWLQGVLFGPHDTAMPPAVDTRPNAQNHQWCRQSELRKIEGRHWLVMPHKQWLMPPSAGREQIRTIEEILQMLDAQQLHPNRALMLVRCEDIENYRAMSAQRLICMPDSWPVSN